MRRDAREAWNAQVLEAGGSPTVPGEAGNRPEAGVGDQVQVQNFSTPGVVTAIRDGGQIEVEMGRLRLRVHKDDIRVLGYSQIASSGRFESSPVLGAEPPAELNVIGQTAEEAREQVDKFLDSAFLSGRFKLRVVHGHGKGVLKNSLREMFASHPHVETFYPAPQREGGEGATIVELKK